MLETGTLSGEIATRLRQDIIGGGLPFGTRLTLSELEVRYESGQMPVREALRQLQGEGLIELIPNRGARVRTVDVDFVRNLFDVRVAIEAMLTRRAAERIQKKQIEALEAAELLYENTPESDVRAILEANRSFHRIINEVAGNSEASEILRRNQQLVTALWHRHGYPAPRSAPADEHRRIIAALRANDSDSAECFAMAHATRAKFDLLERMARA